MEKYLDTLVDMFNNLTDRQKDEVLNRMETSIIMNRMFGIPCVEPEQIILDEYINNVLSTVSELTDYHEKLWKEQKNIVKILNILKFN